MALWGRVRTCEAPVSMAALTNISALSVPPTFGTTTLILRVRLSLSMAAPILATLPSWRSWGRQGGGTRTVWPSRTLGTPGSYASARVHIVGRGALGQRL